MDIDTFEKFFDSFSLLFNNIISGIRNGNRAPQTFKSQQLVQQIRHNKFKILSDCRMLVTHNGG